MATKYTVELRADVYQEVEVWAVDEEDARERAYDEMGDGYEVDFVVQAVWEAGDED